MTLTNEQLWIIGYILIGTHTLAYTSGMEEEYLWWNWNVFKVMLSLFGWPLLIPFLIIDRIYQAQFRTKEFIDRCKNG